MTAPVDREYLLSVHFTLAPDRIRPLMKRSIGSATTNPVSEGDIRGMPARTQGKGTIPGADMGLIE